MAERIVILGAGGHAKVLCATLRLAGYEIIGFLDDDPTLTDKCILGLPVLGPHTEATALSIDGAIVGIGDNRTRRWLYEWLQSVQIPLVNAVHPSAIIAEDVHLGQGVAVLARAVVEVSSWIGDNVIINTAAVVNHDNRVGEHAHIGPGAQLCGGVQIGTGAFIGTSATVIPCRCVGAHSVVGAGAVVTTNLPDNVVAVGVPAQIIKPAPINEAAPQPADSLRP